MKTRCRVSLNWISVLTLLYFSLCKWHKRLWDLFAKLSKRSARQIHVQFTPALHYQSLSRQLLIQCCTSRQSPFKNLNPLCAPSLFQLFVKVTFELLAVREDQILCRKFAAEALSLSCGCELYLFLVSGGRCGLSALVMLSSVNACLLHWDLGNQGHLARIDPLTGLRPQASQASR